MSSGFVNKLKNIVGLAPYLEEEDDEIFNEIYRSEHEFQTPSGSAPEPEVRRPNKSNLKVLSHPNAGGYEVMVLEPRAFDESLEIINHLRERKSVVLNLHLLDEEQSQRVVDFLSGATHAIDGHQQRIGNGVFMFTPSNVPIMAESDKSKAIRDAFWNHSQ